MNLSEQQHLTLKTGNEKFNSESKELDFSLIDFWRWSTSDILSNTTRGILAEFIVAKALKANISQIRTEWDAYDLITLDGIKIEVKSSAYLQTWQQNNYSKISFGTRASKPWDWAIDKRSDIPIRSADVYVFCLLKHMDKATVDPLNLNQWGFYVLATKDLNNYKRSQHSITLNSLKSLAKELSYEEIESEVKFKFHQ